MLIKKTIVKLYTYVYNCMRRVGIYMVNEHNNSSNEASSTELEHNINRRGRRHHGAKTFRRGRALAFYEQLVVKRDTLRKQLKCPEYQSIQQVIAGELKATEAIINDFKAAFELEEVSAEIKEIKPE